MLIATLIISMVVAGNAVAIGIQEPIPFLGLSVEAITDKLLFVDSLAVFLQAKAAKDPPDLIWDDNGCTSSPDKPLGFNFLDSCKRHDFGYRNYRKQLRFTEQNRKRIDDKFKQDLYDECRKYSGPKSRECRKIADVYYQAARTFGGIWPGASQDDIILKIGEDGNYQLGPARER